MSDRDCPDERMVEWIESKKQHGFYVLTREELEKRIDAACTDAYAEGRQDQREELAGRLIEAWCDTHDKPIPWAKAIEITAIVTNMPEAERLRLLALADSGSAA